MGNYIFKKVFFHLIFYIFLFCASTSSGRQVNTEIHNPVIPGDFADPTIIRVGKIYYASGTSSEWAPHFPVFSSENLTDWRQTGYVFSKKPQWAISSFWAPELFRHKNRYYLFYVAKRKSDGVSCIGVAVSDHPEKEFQDKGVLLEWGKEAIDPFVFQDDDRLYLSWKAYGLDNRPIELLAIQLSADGLRTEGDAFTLLRDDQRKLMEGQSIIKKNGWYYIMYSTGGCCGINCSYQVMVARSKSLTSGFVVADKPILSGDEEWKCPGHGTLVETEDQRYYYMYHAYNRKSSVFTGREGMIKELFWDTSTAWPYFRAIDQISVDHKMQSDNLKDDFSSLPLKAFWQWDLSFIKPGVSIKNKKLKLFPTIDPFNKIGTALTTRPYQADYSVSVRLHHNQSQSAGLVIYGDRDNAVGFGINKGEIQVWEIKKTARNILSTTNCSNSDMFIKITVRNGRKLTFFYSVDRKKWIEMAIAHEQESLGELAQWDRSPRPGLINWGNKSAVFSAFEIDYKPN